MAKKEKAARLPKKVGGVKLPKQLRKSAGMMAELAQSPIAREVVSAALVAGAGALAKRRIKGANAPATTTTPHKPGGGEFDSLIAQGKDVGNMLAQGVAAFLGELFKPPVGKADDVPAAAKAAEKPATPKRPPFKASTKTPSVPKPAAAKTARRPAASSRTRAKPSSS